jgi:endonuclease-3
MLDKKDLKTVLTILENRYRDTTTALKFNTPFQLLLSTMLAAQSTDVRVNIVTRTLFEQYGAPELILKLSLEELQQKIKTVGLFKSKAKNILATCRILVDQYQGKVPLSREELMQLPGVGRKTANVVLSIASDFEAIAVDTHVFRVSNRIGLADAGNVLRTEEQLMKNIPRQKWSAAHHWLIWHGRRICKARKPLCHECPLTDFCTFYRRNGIRGSQSRNL